MKTDRLAAQAKIMKKVLGDKPEKVTIYIVTNSTARSNMSGTYSAYVMVDNVPVSIIQEYKVTGCGLDRRYELAYNLFCLAYGYNNPAMRYQDKLIMYSL